MPAIVAMKHTPVPIKTNQVHQAMGMFISARYPKPYIKTSWQLPKMRAQQAKLRRCQIVVIDQSQALIVTKICTAKIKAMSSCKIVLK
ncbi:hypothetical protein CCE29_07075 [Lacticaseibacillus rhamnosus]|uniref:Uncharacterized protein n=1 Tax=Lacticaseibacillus rhamnosus (strain ATCC 53103 / LMG 18243 / GG) TaxID=568703 RepID=A0A830TYU1_LACRG|nr:hypothetical protein [Lacticaseibacillus rhamnosus]OFQ50045.1 hypothetical protein HMPREF2934_00860 [Lactobacillus sp. HMSC073B09]AON64373.1 hypothetical protein BFC96_12520 [Lacticaseibacillus rhamnosus]AQY36017.1 hypothetical protein B4583_12725 [Lacticaseibacillus rhamnosus]ART95732.1 hypothetical protein CCE29_07075 [Lacticaseibacillus rhamnosus]AXI93077.1 hypothetical protein DU507_00140 [Lacticaseibacillus rhamnosus GG]